MDQKPRFRRMPATTAIWRRRVAPDAGAGFSGTARNIARLAQTASPASTTNSVRQSITRSAISTGWVADIAPMAPTRSIQPIRVAMRSSGNHSANAVRDAMKQTATPRPISARPSNSVGKPAANANTAPPSAATSSMVALTRRGP